MEKLNLWGEWKDILTYKDGRVVELPTHRNIITLSGKKLLTGFMKGESLVGIQYVGFGDTPEINVASDADTTLGAEFFRKVPTSVVYVDDAGDVSTPITKNLKISILLGYSEANGSPSGVITEFGIFCGNASATLNTGYLYNHKIHNGIVKNSDVQLQRYITLHF